MATHDELIDRWLAIGNPKMLGFEDIPEVKRLRAEVAELQANLQAECDEHDRVRARNAELRALLAQLIDAIGPDHAANILSERR